MSGREFDSRRLHLNRVLHLDLKHPIFLYTSQNPYTNETMRIVALADTHTFERDFTAPIPDGDVLIHAGDLLREGTLQELEPVAQWLHTLPHPHKIIIAGNHDVCFQTQREQACELLGSEIHYLEDSGVTLEGIRFWGSPWTPRIHDWAFMYSSRECARSKWAQIPDDTDILITHGPPYGIGDALHRRGHLGCSELLHVVQQRVQPLVHMYGHCHSGGGVRFQHSTCFANVTTWECERAPTVFSLDPTSRILTILEAPLGSLYS